MAFLAQPRRQIVHLAARRAIDDARLILVAAEHVQDLPLEIRPRQHAVDEVRPIEGADELQRIDQAELRHDVAAHAHGRRRGERVHAGARQHPAKLGELPILRPEVVAPLADAVRLVDRDEPDRL